jgi:predicted MFS family arabinose efflux permease
MLANHVADDLRHGAALVWRHPLLRPVLLCAVAWNTAWFVLQAAYVPYAVRVLGLDASAVGATLACYGAGMVTGAILVSRVRKVSPRWFSPTRTSTTVDHSEE